MSNFSIGESGSTAAACAVHTSSSHEEAKDIFHKLQLEMAAKAKEEALSKMGQIRAGQEEQKYVASLLDQARQLQADARAGKGDVPEDKNASLMPLEMKEYMDVNGLAYDNNGNDLKNNADEWEVAITSLQSHMETLGMDTEQQMVFIQDDLGQMKSHLNSSEKNFF